MQRIFIGADCNKRDQSPGRAQSLKDAELARKCSENDVKIFFFEKLTSQSSRDPAKEVGAELVLNDAQV